jgi:hypothetical protein
MGGGGEVGGQKGVNTKQYLFLDESMEEEESPSSIHVELSRHVEEIVQVR